MEKFADYRAKIDAELFAATEKGNLAAVRALLEKGANPNHRGAFGRTPFVHAAVCKHPGLFPLLVEFGADPFAAALGDNALLVACAEGHADCAQALLELYPLSDWVAGKPGDCLRHAVSRGHHGVLSVLIPAFVKEGLFPVPASPPNSAAPGSAFKDPQGFTPFMRAVAMGQAECAALLAPHFDMADTDHIGSNALLLAMGSLKRDDPVDTVRALLAAGCDPKATNAYGQTALMLAAKKGKVGCVKLLLPLSDALAADFIKWETALMAAAGMDYLETVQSASSARVEIIRALLPASDPEALNAHGHSALAIAMQRAQEGAPEDSAKAIALLSDASDASRQNLAGQTPFEAALAGQSWFAVEALAPKATDSQIEHLLMALSSTIGPLARARVEAFFLNAGMRETPPALNAQGDDAPALKTPRKPPRV